MSRFLAVTASAEFGHHLSAALGSTHELQLLAPHAVPTDLLAQQPGGLVDVLVLGPDVETEQAFSLASGFDRVHPEIVVVLAAIPSAELMLAAMRSGIRDVIAPDTAAGELRQSLEFAAFTAANRRLVAAGTGDQSGGRGRVISVMSPKGGVGKTTVATNLAVGLAKLAPMGVVILDLDLQFGDVASGLGLEPAYTISDVVSGDASNDAMVLKAYLSPHPSGLYAMCAPLSPAEADLIKPAQVSTLINQLSLEFPFVVVDTAPGLGEEVLAVLELAADGIWVCGMDIPSIRGLNHGLEVLRQLDLMPPSNMIVLNFASRNNGLSIKDVEATIGLPVDIVLPQSRTLPFSTNAGVPLLQNNRKDPVTKGLKNMVRQLTAESSPKNIHRRAEIS